METAAQRPFWVGPWRVEPRSLRLERDTDSHRLTPRAMAVLCCLAAADGEVVRKDELLGAVWGNAVVTEDALTQCIVELRKALGDSARRSSVIETIPRIGFRLIPPIDRGAASPGQRTRWRARLVVMAAALLTTLLYLGQHLYRWQGSARVEAVAVLPFENLSGDPAMRHFSDGLAEELLNSLANVPGLRVPARTSSFAFRDANLDVRELGSRLDVDTLVEGSVRRQGPRLRVTVQLIEAGSGLHRWSEVFEGDAGDLFSLQERIARNVADALGVNRHHLGTPPAVEIEAYDWYLLGRQHLREKVSRQHFGDWVERSRRYFERAIEHNPDFAAAYPWLARSWLPLLHSTRRDEYEQSMAAARSAVDKALSLDPALADAYAVRGWIDTNEGDDRGVETSLRRALELDPHHVDAALQLAQHLWRRGFPQEAGVLFERTRTLDPYNVEVLRSYAEYLGYTGRYEQARAIFENLMPASSHSFMNFTCEHGRLVDCVRIAREAVLASPQDVFALADLVAAYRALNEDDLAQRWLEEALRRSGDSDPLESFFYSGAVLRLERGEFETLLRELGDRMERVELMPDEKPSPRVYAQLTLYARALTFAGKSAEAARIWDRVFEFPEMMTYAEMPARLARRTQAAYAYRAIGRSDAYDRMVGDALEFVRRVAGHPVSDYPPLAAEIATFHALLGQHDAALEHLRSAVEHGWRDRRPAHPAWSVFESDPDYELLIATVDKDVEKQRARVRELGWFTTPRQTLATATRGIHRP